MMNVIFVLFARRAFSDVTEGVDSINFSLPLLAWSRPPSFRRDFKLVVLCLNAACTVAIH